RRAAPARNGSLPAPPRHRAADGLLGDRLPLVLPLAGARGLGPAELALTVAARRRLADASPGGCRRGARAQTWRRGRRARYLPAGVHAGERHPPRRSALRNARAGA